jgi:hypothetical protein
MGASYVTSPVAAKAVNGAVPSRAILSLSSPSTAGFGGSRFFASSLLKNRLGLKFLP